MTNANGSESVRMYTSWVRPFDLFLEDEYILDYFMNSFNKKKWFSVFRIPAHTCIMQIVQKKKSINLNNIMSSTDKVGTATRYFWSTKF